MSALVICGYQSKLAGDNIFTICVLNTTLRIVDLALLIPAATSTFVEYHEPDSSSNLHLNQISQAMQRGLHGSPIAQILGRNHPCPVSGNVFVLIDVNVSNRRQRLSDAAQNEEGNWQTLCLHDLFDAAYSRVHVYTEIH